MSLLVAELPKKDYHSTLLTKDTYREIVINTFLIAGVVFKNPILSYPFFIYEVTDSIK